MTQVRATPPGLRERRKLATRAALVTAALRLFDTRGYAEVTVEEICAAAEVSPRTFFRYFPAKDDVLLAPLLEMLEADIADLRARPADESTWAALRAVLTAAAARIDADRREETLQAVRTLRRSPEALAANARAITEAGATLALVVADRGGLDHPDLAARVLTGRAIAAYQAAIETWVDSGGAGSLAALVGEALALGGAAAD